ncbi:amino acid ABC transporter permease [Brucella pituitosa]|uniref:Amino acid ABC transporter permease n=1 Tax=Brucella pituitosa TaxID=571256 RepID=A0ABS3K419_9HYPH|nr:amino acid ABC transporter permease [Brucella pituitosa]MBO1041162.1 amino acid ABC transporter permease [Brucella pituitosa]
MKLGISSSRWTDRLITSAVIALVVLLLFPVMKWALIDAVWGAKPASACSNRGGACWPVIAEKGTLILFGRYPATELWRPIIASVVLLGTAVATAVPRLWGRGLFAAWIYAPMIFLILMSGGVAGLAPVSWTQWGGLPITIMLSVFGIGLAFPLGILLACGRVSSQPVVRLLSTGYIEVMRGVPLITVLFMATFILPLLLPQGWTLSLLVRAQVAIILFAAAYLAEVVRAGIQMVPKGQYEACEGLGLSRFETYTKVVLPQALTMVIAPTINTFIAVLKDTSLVAIMSISELLLSARQALADPVWRTHFIEVYIFIALIYFIFCFAMGKWSKHLEQEYVVSKAR